MFELKGYTPAFWTSANSTDDDCQTVSLPLVLRTKYRLGKSDASTELDCACSAKFSAELFPATKPYFPEELSGECVPGATGTFAYNCTYSTANAGAYPLFYFKDDAYTDELFRRICFVFVFVVAVPCCVIACRAISSYLGLGVFQAAKRISIRLRQTVSSVEDTAEANWHEAVDQELDEAKQDADLQAAAAARADATIARIANDAGGHAAAWAISHAFSWFVLGVFLLLDNTGSSVMTPNYILVVLIVIAAEHLLRRWMSFLVQWVPEKVESFRFFEYHSGLFEVVGVFVHAYYCKWSFDLFRFAINSTDRWTRSMRICLHGKTYFTGFASSAKPETMLQSLSLLYLPLFTISILMPIFIFALRDAILRSQHAAVMAEVAECVEANEQLSAKHLKHTKQHTQHTHKSLRLIKFYSQSLTIVIALEFDMWLDDFVDVLVGCNEHYFWVDQTSCLSQGPAHTHGLQFGLQLLFASTLTIIITLLETAKRYRKERPSSEEIASESETEESPNSGDSSSLDHSSAEIPRKPKERPSGTSRESNRITELCVGSTHDSDDCYYCFEPTGDDKGVSL